jgi:hypothetical protein
MKVNRVKMQFFEDTKKSPQCVWQVPAQIRLHGETVRSHSLTQRAKISDRVHARVVALVALQTAHLRDERLGPAYLHAVDYVRYFHNRLETSDSTVPVYSRLQMLIAASRSIA